MDDSVAWEHEENALRARTAGPRPLETLVAVPALGGQLPAEPPSVAFLRDAMVGFASAHGAVGEVLDDIAFAVANALTDVVEHPAPGLPATVRFEADIEQHALEIVITDDTTCPPSPARDRRAEVAEHCDDFTVGARNRGGTELWMRFELGARYRPS